MKMRMIFLHIYLLYAGRCVTNLGGSDDRGDLREQPAQSDGAGGTRGGQVRAGPKTGL